MSAHRKSWAPWVRRKLYRKQHGICSWCRTELWDGPLAGHHIDHWIPVSKGGADEVLNLRLLHAYCNLRKRNFYPTESRLNEARENAPTAEEAKAAATGQPVLIHGTNRGYNHWRCRCQPCKTARVVSRNSHRKQLDDDDRRHGTVNGYDYWRCRCQPCKRAHAAHNIRNPHRKQLTDDDPRHGTSTGYNYWGCKCQPCKTAAAAVRARQRAAKKASDVHIAVTLPAVNALELTGMSVDMCVPGPVAHSTCRTLVEGQFDESL